MNSKFHNIDVTLYLTGVCKESDRNGCPKKRRISSRVYQKGFNEVIQDLTEMNQDLKESESKRN